MLFIYGSLIVYVLAIASSLRCLARWAFGGSPWLWLMIGVAGEGKLVGEPLVEIVGRCIVRGSAVLLRGLATRIGSVFLIRGQARGWCLVEPLADLLDVLRVFRISNGFIIGPNLP